MLNEEDIEICGPKNLDPNDCLGYGARTKPVYIVINVVSIIINILFVLGFFARIKYKHNESVINLDKFFFVLSVVDIIISVLWLFNISLFFKVSDMESNCKGVRVLATFMLMFYIIDWLLVTQTIREIKVVMTNPIKKTKSNSKFFTIVAICLIFAGVLALISYFVGLTGISVS